MTSANSFGARFTMMSFGESHGAAIGVVIDGCPSQINWDEKLLLTELARRRPGQTQSSSVTGMPISVVSDRQEDDQPEVLSGVFQGQTLGSPIAVIVRNRDARSEDYQEIAQSPRAGHADDVWNNKFKHSDPRGGGRSSGRETLSRVIAGSVAQMFLKNAFPELRVIGFARKIGPLELSSDDLSDFIQTTDAYAADRFTARFPSQSKQADVEQLLLNAKAEGHSYGGIAEIWVEGMPENLGQPVFHKLKADLASAFMGVGATAAVEIGDGFSVTEAEGSEFHRQTAAAHYGGTRGGMSTGEKLILRVGFKPTSSVLDTAKKGRHDPCIVPRAIPVLEAMTFLVLADHVLWARTDRASMYG